LNYFSQFDEDIFLSTKLKGLSPKESIIYLISSSVEYYENYPAITSIMQIFDVLRYDYGLEDKVKSIFNNRNRFIKQLVEEAQRCGEIRSDIDSENISVLISGLSREICLKWRLDNRKFPLKEETLRTLHELINAFSL
jgi:hypothetical protein